MAEEQLIWRPNSIPLDVWVAMSRQDQIAWWKSQPKAPPEPKLHMKEAVSLYNEGVYTVSGFVCFVCKLAASDEIEEFVNTCPANLLAALNESLANYGEDENTWPRTFHSGCYAPWTTPEEIEESSRKRQQQIWDGVRILKKKLSERK